MRWSVLVEHEEGLMTSDAVSARGEAIDERECAPEELSATELDAVSGGWSVDFGLFKVTGGDVANAARWVWNHV